MPFQRLENERQEARFCSFRYIVTQEHDRPFKSALKTAGLSITTATHGDSASICSVTKKGDPLDDEGKPEQPCEDMYKSHGGKEGRTREHVHKDSFARIQVTGMRIDKRACIKAIQGGIRSWLFR